MISRLEAGYSSENTNRVDLAEAVRDVVELYEPVAEEAGVTHGLVVHHFGSRDALIEEALAHTIRTSLSTSALEPGTGKVADFSTGLSDMVTADPGTQAFSRREAMAMCSDFRLVRMQSRLSFGDLLQGAVGQRHRSRLLTAAKHLWPRWLIRRALPTHGLMLLIDAVK